MKLVSITIFTLLLISCGASNKIIEPNVALDEMMRQKTFRIAVISAEPQLTQAMSQVANNGLIPPGNSLSRINVAGDGYFIKVNGDSVAADLPYFGERQMGGGYGSDSGIKFDGQTKNLEISKDETKQRYTIKFSIEGNSENYAVTINAANNLTSTTTIQSLQRNRIRYGGAIKEIKATK